MEMEIIYIFFHKHFPCNTPCKIYVKTLKFSLGRVYARGKIRFVRPCVDKAKGLQQKGQFVEKEASFYTQGKFRLAQELSSFWLWSLLSPLASTLYPCYAMYDLCI